MIPSAYGLCSFCNGDGKCSECDGTGINPHISEPEPKCQGCSGTGVCASCLGTGRAQPRETEIQDLGLDRL